MDKLLNGFNDGLHRSSGVGGRNSDNEQILLPKKPTGKDKKEIKERLMKEYGTQVNYNSTENVIYLFDNSILSSGPFISLLSEFRLFVAPNLF